jgi:hypothetical protein
VAAGHSVDPARWPGMLDELMGRIGGRFARVEPWRRARAFVLGLLADLPCKNCWSIAEHAGDASPDDLWGAAEHALIDREPFLPRSWTADPARCKAAGIPGGIRFATKPRLARRMITRALDAGTPAGWVAGDEVYGGDPGLSAGWNAGGPATCWPWLTCRHHRKCDRAERCTIP